MNKSGIVTHKKTGADYTIVSQSKNLNNLSQKVITCIDDSGQTFVCVEDEFWDTFKWKEPECCCCGTKAGLHWDGAWYGYRCDSDDCIVF